MPDCLLIVLVIAFLTGVLTLQFRCNWHALQYLYFLRAPILLSIALLILLSGAYEKQSNDFPYLTPTGELKNLYILNGWDIYFASFFYVLTAWTIFQAIQFLYVNIPRKVQLTLKEDASGNPILNKIGEDDFLGKKHALYSLAATPFIGNIIYLSADEVNFYIAIFIGILGIISVHALRWLILWLIGTDIISKSRLYKHLKQKLQANLGASEFIDNDSAKLTRKNAYLYGITTLAIYCSIGIAMNPDRTSLPHELRISALVYILIFMIMLTWLYSVMTYKLDKYRIPAEVIFLLWGWFFYSVFEVEHTYTVTELKNNNSPSVIPAQYIGKWKALRDENRMIVIAASGGGLKAAYWTSLVLTKLQKKHPDFADAIILISSTSGGSVGAMYYIYNYGYDESGKDITEPDIAKVLEQSGHTSLDAMAWGLVYPDFLRYIFPPLSFDMDRGQSIERRWQQLLGKDSPKLSQWRKEVAAGWRPAVIFNATLAETGDRFLISPLDLQKYCNHADSKWRAKTFSDLYPDTDLYIATAARLSATFPYITPLSRPSKNINHREWKRYHVGDGGYYDNFGIMSAIEFIRNVHDIDTTSDVLLLEIRASSRNDKDFSDGKTWKAELLDPLTTMESVRGSSQLDRGDLEVSLLQEVMRHRLKRVIFELGTDSPLSWHLSKREKSEIEDYLDNHFNDGSEQVQAVLDFLDN